MSKKRSDNIRCIREYAKKDGSVSFHARNAAQTCKAA